MKTKNNLVNFLFRHHTNSMDGQHTNGLQLGNVRQTFHPKTYYGLHFSRKFTWHLPHGVTGALSVWGKVCNDNFSKVLTKSDQNSGDTAPIRIPSGYFFCQLQVKIRRTFRVTIKPLQQVTNASIYEMKKKKKKTRKPMLVVTFTAKAIINY